MISNWISFVQNNDSFVQACLLLAMHDYTGEKYGP